MATHTSEALEVSPALAGIGLIGFVVVLILFANNSMGSENEARRKNLGHPPDCLCCD